MDIDPTDISCGGDERSPANCGGNAGILVSSTANNKKKEWKGDPEDGAIFQRGLVPFVLIASPISSRMNRSY